MKILAGGHRVYGYISSIAGEAMHKITSSRNINVQSLLSSLQLLIKKQNH